MEKESESVPEPTEVETVGDLTNEAAPSHPESEKTTYSEEKVSALTISSAERWELVREWSGIVLGFIGAISGVLALLVGIHGQNRTDLIETRQLYAEINATIDRAWDLLGGQENTEDLRARRKPSRSALVAASRLPIGAAPFFFCIH